MQRAIILKIPFKKHDHSVNIVCNLNSSSAIYCACFSILLNILLLHVLKKDATPWYHYLYIYLFNNMYIKPLIYILEGVCVCVYACYELPCACIFCLSVWFPQDKCPQWHFWGREYQHQEAFAFLGRLPLEQWYQFIFSPAVH